VVLELELTALLCYLQIRRRLGMFCCSRRWRHCP